MARADISVTKNRKASHSRVLAPVTTSREPSSAIRLGAELRGKFSDSERVISRGHIVNRDARARETGKKVLGEDRYLRVVRSVGWQICC